MSDSEFQLENDPPRPRPAKFGDDQPARQILLLADMDDDPDQALMFPVNGGPDRDAQTITTDVDHDEVS